MFCGHRYDKLVTTAVHVELLLTIIEIIALLYIFISLYRKYMLIKTGQTNERTPNTIFYFPPRRPGFNPGSGQVGFVVDKVAPGKVFSEYFGFPCHSCHQILHLHNHPGQVQ
jgi:hypothetical protein